MSDAGAGGGGVGGGGGGSVGRLVKLDPRFRVCRDYGFAVISLACEPVHGAGAGAGAAAGGHDGPYGSDGPGEGDLVDTAKLRWSQYSCTNFFTVPDGQERIQKEGIKETVVFEWSRDRKTLVVTFQTMSGMRLWDLYKVVLDSLSLDRYLRTAKGIAGVHLRFLAPLEGRLCTFNDRDPADPTGPARRARASAVFKFVVMEGNRRLTLARLLCQALMTVTATNGPIPVMTQRPERYSLVRSIFLDATRLQELSLPAAPSSCPWCLLLRSSRITR